MRFGPFEVDFVEHQVSRQGARIKLQKKPLQVLHMLLQRPGSLVLREELARELWPDVHVRYERSLNTAVNVLRTALGDSPRSPQFVETCSGLGYRFIAPVEVIHDRDTSTPAAPAALAANTEAQTDHQKGLFFYAKMTPEDLSRAQAHFKSAIDADPAHAGAYAGLANVQNLKALWSLEPTPPASGAAMEYAERALSLDPGLSEARVALVTARRIAGFEVHSGHTAKQYQEVIAADPNCSSALLWYADWLCAAGKQQDALAHAWMAHRLDPLSLLINFELGWILYASGQFKAAHDHSWRTLTLEPRFAPAQYTLGLACEQLGHLDEAITEFDNARICSGDHPAAVSALAHALALAGQRSQAHHQLEILTSLGQQRFVSRFWHAIARAGLGDMIGAEKEIQNAAASGDVLAQWARIDPRLRGLPSFATASFSLSHRT